LRLVRLSSSFLVLFLSLSLLEAPADLIFPALLHSSAPEASKPVNLQFWKKKAKSALGEDWIDDELRDSSHPSVHSSVALIGDRYSDRKKKIRQEQR